MRTRRGRVAGNRDAPSKLVSAGFSSFLVSLGMVAGGFVARWTVPSLIEGSDYVWQDLREKRHLIIWAILAGMCWAVVNTLTVFAIRDVGLSIAFPLWNANSLVGLFWGWALFRELRGGGARNWLKVPGGTLAIVAGSCILAYATAQQSDVPPRQVTLGILAALGAAALWGTMYVPYRKAYISGLKSALVCDYLHIWRIRHSSRSGSCLRRRDPRRGHGAFASPRGVVLALSGRLLFGIGDLFQQYAAKYIGIGRGIPLSNTN